VSVFPAFSYSLQISFNALLRMLCAFLRLIIAFFGTLGLVLPSFLRFFTSPQFSFFLSRHVFPWSPDVVSFSVLLVTGFSAFLFRLILPVFMQPGPFIVLFSQLLTI